MKTVYFVRHGEAEGNVLNITAGSEINTPLTNKGRMQAKQAAQDFKQKDIDLIVSSPLARAYNTAVIIAEEIGYAPSKIIKKQNFTERSIGSMAGVPYAQWKDAFLSDTLPSDVESAEAMYRRAKSGLTWLKSQKAQHIILVSHDGFNKALQGVLRGIPSNRIKEIEDLGNTSTYKFELK